MVTTPPCSTKALEMLLKLRKSSCCWGSDCRPAMLFWIRAAAWGQARGGGGFETVLWAPHLLLATPNLTSMHQLSQSIFSCWAVGWPSLRDLEALVGSGRQKFRAVTLAQDPLAAQASHTASSPGKHHHHGIEVNGTVCQTLQHKLFICQVDGMGGGVLVGGRGTGRGGSGVGLTH